MESNITPTNQIKTNLQLFPPSGLANSIRSFSGIRYNWCPSDTWPLPFDKLPKLHHTELIIQALVRADAQAHTPYLPSTSSFAHAHTQIASSLSSLLNPEHLQWTRFQILSQFDTAWRNVMPMCVATEVVNKHTHTTLQLTTSNVPDLHDVDQ